MNKFFSIILATTVLANPVVNAQQQQQTTNDALPIQCVNTASFVATIKRYEEVPNLLLSNEDSNLTLLSNSITGTWTLAYVNIKPDKTCIIASGDKIKVISPISKFSI